MGKNDNENLDDATKLYVRVALLEQSNKILVNQIKDLIETVKSLCHNASMQTGAQKMKERFINGTVTFLLVSAAFELHKYL